MLVAFCVASIMLGKFQTGARNAGRTDPVGHMLGMAVNPVSGVLAVGLNGTSDFFSGVFSARTLRVENRSLRDLQKQMALYNEVVERLQRENDYVRKLINLPETAGKTKIPADVINLYTYENRITVSAGSNLGVRPGQPVVTGDGLLGIVQTVDTTTSQVLLLSGLSTKRIGAVARRNPPPAGLLKGEGYSLLTLEFVDPKAPVEVGDEVFTAGYSDMIPSGIRIGRIIQVSDDPTSGMRRASIFPSVAMGRVREVVILK